MDVLGRAVSAFRQSVSKSKSSGSLANSEQCDDNSSCSASIASMHSSTSISSYLARRSSHSSATSSPTSRMSYLRRLQQKQNRRSKSATRPGDDKHSQTKHSLDNFTSREKGQRMGERKGERKPFYGFSIVTSGKVHKGNSWQPSGAENKG